MGAAIARHTHLNPTPPVIVLAVWDSVTQTLISSESGTVTGVRTGNIVQLSFEWRNASGEPWGKGQIGTIPYGWRPKITTYEAWSGRDGESQRQFILKTDGTMIYQNMGAKQDGGYFSGTLVYVVAD